MVSVSVCIVVFVCIQPCIVACENFVIRYVVAVESLRRMIENSDS